MLEAAQGEFNPPEQKTFDDKIANAQHTLESAWKLDPTQSTTAWLLMIAEQYMRPRQEGADNADPERRKAMEQWFARAVEANPDDPRPWETKLAFLSPEWYGSEQDRLAFARNACGLRTGGRASR